MKMRWLSSTGGPLVLLPRTLCTNWKGSSGDASDYELACSVNRYLGIIAWRDRDLLVLGDEPLQTTVIDGKDGIVLLRWMYSPNEDELSQCLDPASWGTSVEVLEWYALDTAHVLIDSALRGDSSADRFEFRVSAGPHTISTYVAKPHRDVAAVVHAFEQR